jgi:hypothetical protein
LEGVELEGKEEVEVVELFIRGRILSLKEEREEDGG